MEEYKIAKLLLGVSDVKELLPSDPPLMPGGALSLKEMEKDLREDLSELEKDLRKELGVHTSD